MNATVELKLRCEIGDLPDDLQLWLFCDADLFRDPGAEGAGCVTHEFQFVH